MHRPRGPKRSQEREPVRQGNPEATPTVLDPSLVGVQERRKGGAGEEVQEGRWGREGLTATAPRYNGFTLGYLGRGGGEEEVQERRRGGECQTAGQSQSRVARAGGSLV